MTTPEERAELQRGLDRERGLEAAKPPLAKLREDEQQVATGHPFALDLATIFVGIVVVVVTAWGLLR